MFMYVLILFIQSVVVVLSQLQKVIGAELPNMLN